MPKFNMYQSLHTTVIGPDRQAGGDADPHVRDAPHGRVRHRRALAVQGAQGRHDRRPAGAHRRDDLAAPAAGLAARGEPTRASSSTRCASTCPARRCTSSRPKGDVIALPTGSTPVDFAYAVHTEVGHKCIGARVNGKLVPLESTLSNGDVIEIFTSKSETAGPTQDWLGFVKSPRARTKIRQYFNKERREEAIEDGKDAIVKAMRKQGLPLQRMLTSDALMTIARDLHLADVAVALRGGRREPGLGPVGGAEAGRRRTAARRARPRTSPRPPIADPAAAQPHAAAHDPGVVVRGRQRRLDQAGPLLHAGARRPDLRLRHPLRRGQRAPRRLRQRRATCGQQPERVVEVSWKPTVRVDVPGRDPGRGARPAQAARRRDPGALRRAGQHPLRDGHHHPRPGGGEPVHASRWPTRSTWATCWPRCARWTASSTRTGSPPAPEPQRRPVTDSGGARRLEPAGASSYGAGQPRCRSWSAS